MKRPKNHVVIVTSQYSKRTHAMSSNCSSGGGNGGNGGSCSGGGVGQPGGNGQ